MSKTVKVRILVAVDHTGCWSSIGYDGMRDEDAQNEIFTDVMEHGELRRWITAEVPIPEASDIVGGVE